MRTMMMFGIHHLRCNMLSRCGIGRGSGILIQQRQRHLTVTTTSSPSSSFAYDRDTGIVSERASGAPLLQTVIGLEIHARLAVPTKLFSRAPTAPTTAPPNTLLCPFDVAYPGALPVLSYDAVRAAVLSCAALGCPVEPVSRFERKHYFYADAPHGYQITQQRWPISHGRASREGVQVGIERIQLETDTGKTIHHDGTSYLDLNRAGRALIEIVYRPDLRSAHGAARTVAHLRSTLRWIGTCDGKMEDGSLRCDLNVSVAPYHVDDGSSTMDDSTTTPSADDPFAGSLPPGTGHRVEVKNLNSLKQIVAATEYEALRQATESAHRLVQQETRTYDVDLRRTVRIRGKGGAVDYRFLPDPNLPPLVLLDNINNNNSFGNGETLSSVLSALPELPDAACARLREEYGLTAPVAELLTSTDHVPLSLFEHSVSEAVLESGDTTMTTIAAAVGNWITNDLSSLVNANNSNREQDEKARFVLTPRQLGQLVAMVLDDTVSKRTAKKILHQLFNDDDDTVLPRTVAERRGWNQITDPARLTELCRSVLERHPKERGRYHTGEAKKMEKFFAGAVMRESKGNAHPERTREILQELLQNEDGVDDI